MRGNDESTINQTFPRDAARDAARDAESAAVLLALLNYAVVWVVCLISLAKNSQSGITEAKHLAISLNQPQTL